MRPLRSRGLAALELWDEPDWSAFTFARFLNSDRHISTLLFLPFFGAAVDIPPPLTCLPCLLILTPRYLRYLQQVQKRSG